MALCLGEEKVRLRLTIVVNENPWNILSNVAKIPSLSYALMEGRSKVQLFCVEMKENPQLLEKKTVRKGVSPQIHHEFRKILNSIKGK